MTAYPTLVTCIVSLALSSIAFASQNCIDAFLPQRHNNKWRMSAAEKLADHNFSEVDISAFHLSIMIPVHFEFDNSNLKTILTDIANQTRIELKQIRVFLFVNNTSVDFHRSTDAFRDNKKLYDAYRDPDSWLHSFKDLRIHWRFAIDESAPHVADIGAIRQRLEQDTFAERDHGPQHIVQWMDADVRIPPHFARHLLARYALYDNVDVVFTNALPRLTSLTDLQHKPNLVKAFPFLYASNAAELLQNNSLGLCASSPVRMSMRSSAMKQHQIGMKPGLYGEDCMLAYQVYRAGLKSKMNWSTTLHYAFRARVEGYDAAHNQALIDDADAIQSFDKTNPLANYLAALLMQELELVADRSVVEVQQEEELDLVFGNPPPFAAVPRAPGDSKFSITDYLNFNYLIGLRLESLSKVLGYVVEFGDSQANSQILSLMQFHAAILSLDIHPYVDSPDGRNFPEVERALFEHVIDAVISFLASRSGTAEDLSLFLKSSNMLLANGVIAEADLEHAIANFSKLYDRNNPAHVKAEKYIALLKDCKKNADSK